MFEFDRFLCQKLADLFVEFRMPPGRQKPGYVCQPTRKRYFSVPHRSYVGTIYPIKKIDGITFVMPRPSPNYCGISYPGRAPACPPCPPGYGYGPAKPKRSEYNFINGG